MLVEFRVGNYRSFHEPQTLSLVASSDRTHAGNLIPCGKENLLKAAAVYGANASGKSNLIQAMGSMGALVRDSATKTNVGDKIDVVPFRLDRVCKDQPSLFEVTLHLDNVRFRYGFKVSRERVHEEWLVAYPKSRAQRWYERRFDPGTDQTYWTFRNVVKRYGSLLKERTRENGLALSRGAELNIMEMIHLYRWFTSAMRVFDLSESPLDNALDETAQHFLDDEDFRRRVTQLIRDADLGIKRISVGYLPTPTIVVGGKTISPSPRTTPENNDVRQTTGTFCISSVRSSGNTDEDEIFGFDDAESKGTQRLFGLAKPWLDALENGSIIVVDELDCSMHPVLVRRLIELFQSATTNRNGAQLVFATHDSTLMDQSLFRRDQIWIVEKDARQASQLFSLYDFDEKPRKGEALEKRYLAGRYGGVPTFGPTFEDLELR